MFLPRNFPFKTQLDYSYSTFELINAKSSLPFWLLSNSLSCYWGTKLLKKRNRWRKGSLAALKGEGENHPKCRCVTKRVPEPVSACLFQSPVPGECLCCLLEEGGRWPHQELFLMPTCQCLHCAPKHDVCITAQKHVLIWNILFWALFLQICSSFKSC